MPIGVVITAILVIFGSIVGALCCAANENFTHSVSVTKTPRETARYTTRCTDGRVTETRFYNR